jgi:hypothetical protein
MRLFQLSVALLLGFLQAHTSIAQEYNVATSWLAADGTIGTTGKRNYKATIQRGLNENPTGSRSLFFPPGDYLIDGSLTINYSQTTIRGSGDASRLIAVGGTSTAYCPIVSFDKDAIEIRDLLIRSNRGLGGSSAWGPDWTNAAGSATNASGLYIQGSLDFTAHNLTIAYFATGADR